MKDSREGERLDDKPQPVVFLCATLWWPTSPRLAMAFLNSGCKVSAVCPIGHPLRTVAGMDSIYPYRGWNSSGSLKAAIRATQPDLIVPCDDGAVWQLHELYKTDVDLRPLIERSIGASEAYSTLESRNQTLKVAAELGIRVAPTQAVESAEDFFKPQLEWPAVLKSDGTSGGEGLAHVLNPSQAVKAFPTLFGAWRSLMAWKLFLINRQPVALWLWRRRNGSTITLQKFISGPQATTMFACWRGNVLASVTVDVLATQGPSKSATILRLLRNEEIEDASRLLAKRFELSGFHGLDFVIEGATHAAYLIEMNPRATQLGHLNVCPQGNLADALAAKLWSRTAPPAAVVPRIQSDTIALFPRAWQTAPGNKLLSTAYQDVPWEQPALVQELMRKSWPERRLINRILNGLWSMRPQSKKHADAQGGKGHPPLSG